MMFDKIGFILGYIKLVIYKIAYGRQLQINWNIRFMPSSKIRIGKNAVLKMWSNFSSRYSLLIKVNEGATVSIGNNVFINHNSSIVSMGVVCR